MRKALTIALLLIAALAAAPAARAADVETVPFEAVAADGTPLRGKVYLPRDAPRPLATVLRYSPYYGGATDFPGSEQGSGPDNPETSFLLDAGFAFAAVNMRGTGGSGGCMQYGNATDVSDVATVVQALAAEPWSNGNVGMTGHSYPGWTSFMGAAAHPPALKAVVPMSGVIDLWSLLTRRGAPLTSGEATLFPPLFTGIAGHTPPNATQLDCPGYPSEWYDNAQITVTGDRTQFFEARDLRPRLADTPVPVMSTLGMVYFSEGHALQHEGLWDLLDPNRTRIVFGQWGHDAPTGHKPGWHEQVVQWFDHYLRGGPELQRPGVVEYQDDALQWHTTDGWPPPSRTTTVHLSGDRVVPDGEPVEPVDATFQSADNDPGLRSRPDDGDQIYNSTCGPHQVLFASAPLKRDALLAGNFEADLTLSSTLPGGNLSVFLWRAKGDGSCPDQDASHVGRALMDLRHWETPGHSRDFPVGVPTRVQLRSHPLAAAMHEGERLVVAIGGGSSELEPDRLHPLITVTGGTLEIPVAGAAPLRFAASELQQELP